MHEPKLFGSHSNRLCKPSPPKRSCSFLSNPFSLGDVPAFGPKEGREEGETSEAAGDSGDFSPRNRLKVHAHRLLLPVGLAL